MPVPSAPTLEEIVAEGLNKGGESSPSTSLTTRATDIWIEEIKNDIWHLCKNPKLLQITSYGIFNQGQSKYSNPSDFSSDLTLSILDGQVRGTAQAGTIASITLAADDASGEEIIGKEIMILAGTGQGSWSQITDYSTTTKLATVTPNFDTAPSSSSEYMIIDREYPVESRPIFQRDEINRTFVTGIANQFYPIGDEDFGEFILNKAPDKAYGARLRYYANIMKIDTDSTHMSTIYQRWRSIFVLGIAYRQLEDNDDDKDGKFEARYKEKLFNLINREAYGIDISRLQDRVSDYS